MKIQAWAVALRKRIAHFEGLRTNATRARMTRTRKEQGLWLVNKSTDCLFRTRGSHYCLLRT